MSCVGIADIFGGYHFFGFLSSFFVWVSLFSFEVAFEEHTLIFSVMSFPLLEPFRVIRPASLVLIVSEELRLRLFFCATGRSPRC